MTTSTKWPLSVSSPRFGAASLTPNWLDLASHGLGGPCYGFASAPQSPIGVTARNFLRRIICRSLVSVGTVEPHWCDVARVMEGETVEAVSVGSVEPHWCEKMELLYLRGAKSFSRLRRAPLV